MTLDEVSFVDSETAAVELAGSTQVAGFASVEAPEVVAGQFVAVATEAFVVEEGHRLVVESFEAAAAEAVVEELVFGLADLAEAAVEAG